MLEDILDKMPENILNNIFKKLAIIKYINIMMVRIRNNIFYFIFFFEEFIIIYFIIYFFE